MLQLQAGFELKTAAAAVIARESSEFRRTITLDKGTEAGIVVGDVVVASGGALAGRVTAVGPQSATVVLLTDGASTVIGQLPSAATGEVEGHLADTLPMTQIDASATIAVGDEVVTAGIELGSGVRSPYPKGLVIGQVVDVKRDANDVVQTAFLQPAADLERLEYVLVILDYEGGLPPIDEQPVACPSDGTLPEGESPCFASPRAEYEASFAEAVGAVDQSAARGRPAARAGLRAIEGDAPVAQRHERVVPDDEVVEQLDVQQPAGRQRRRGQVEIVRGGCRVAAWMVMHEDDSRCIESDGIAIQLPHPHERRADVALVDRGDPQDVVLRVEQDDAELLALQAAHLQDQPVREVARAADDRPGLRPVRQHPPAELERGDELRRLGAADARDRAQFQLRCPGQLRSGRRGEPGRRRPDRPPIDRACRTPRRGRSTRPTSARPARAGPGVRAVAPSRGVRGWPDPSPSHGHRPPVTPISLPCGGGQGVPGPERRKPADTSRHPDPEDTAQPIERLSPEPQPSMRRDSPAAGHPGREARSPRGPAGSR